MSYYIDTQRKGLKYIFNDCNSRFKEMYDVIKDDEKVKQLEDDFNALLVDIDKVKYNTYVKDKTKLVNWLLGNKVYCIRPNLFPIKQKTFTPLKLSDAPIYNFFRTADITFLNGDATPLIEEYGQMPNVLFLLDPPYLLSCNDYYDIAQKDKTKNIYQYLYENSLSTFRAKIMLVLEPVWMIKLLFDKFIKFEYGKRYEQHHRKTTHIIITNFDLPIKVVEDVKEVEEVKPKIKRVRKPKIVE
jgi:site-specific DNA-adenine methylase